MALRLEQMAIVALGLGLHNQSLCTSLILCPFFLLKHFPFVDSEIQVKKFGSVFHPNNVLLFH